MKNQMKYMRLFLKYLSYLMVIVYLVFSLILLFTKIYATDMQPVFRYALGGIFFFYGFFRCYRVYNEQKNNPIDDE